MGGLANSGLFSSSTLSSIGSGGLESLGYSSLVQVSTSMDLIALVPSPSGS